MAKKTSTRTTPQQGPIVVNQITVAQLQRGNQDIQKWFQAVKSAEQQPFPNRRPLYNTFLDVTIDLHLDAMMDKRSRALKLTPFEWIGLENEPIIENFKQAWFLHMLDQIGQSFFWGTTLMEAQIGQDGLIDDMILIPRQNVSPERGVIMPDGYSENGGIRYREGLFTKYIIQFRRNDDLGKLTKLAPYVIMKRMNLADFSRYNEMFGIPLRVYKYNPSMVGSREETEKQAQAHGSAAYIIIPENMANVEIVEGNKSASAMAFDKLHEILNKEITIGVLGQTLTTGGEGGGSRALGQVHQFAESEINLEDRLYAEYIINYPFKNNILIPHGYPLQGINGRFKVVDELPKEAKANMWIMFSKAGLPIAAEDFYTEFGIPMPEQRNVLPPPKPEARQLNAGLAALTALYKGAPFSTKFATLSFSSDLDKIIEQVMDGSLKAGDVDPALWRLVTDRLFDGVEEGFGTKLEKSNLASEEVELLRKMKGNVAVFSGFKNYQFLRLATDLLTDAAGNLKSFTAFRNDILALNAQYNVNFLSAEYNHAVASGQSARKWQQAVADKGTLPLLQYLTAGDGRVRPPHDALDLIIKPVDDPFWDKYLPPNGWNCRCTTRQLPEGPITITQDDKLPQFQPMFLNNTGKNGVVFPSSHPYFNIDPAHQDRADNNFGLPINE